MRTTTLVVCALSMAWGSTACSKKLDCGPNAYVNDNPAFCLALPAGYKAEKPSGTQTVSMSVHPEKSILGFTVYWNDNKDSLEENAKRVDNMGGGLSDLKLEGKGDVPNGKWWKFQTGVGTTFAVVLVGGKQGVIRCELQNTPADRAGTELEACKSLRAN